MPTLLLKRVANFVEGLIVAENAGSNLKCQRRLTDGLASTPNPHLYQQGGHMQEEKKDSTHINHYSLYVPTYGWSNAKDSNA